MRKMKTTQLSKGDTLLMREAIDEAIQNSRINKPIDVDEEVDDLVIEYSERISKFNFNNDTLDNEKEKQQRIISKKSNNKLIKEVNAEYVKLYPNHTIIPLPDLLNILKKYDLYSGKTKYYNKLIPQKNLIEMEKFWDESEQKDFFGFGDFDLNSVSGLDISDISQLHNYRSSYRSNNDITTNILQIVAPLNEFKLSPTEKTIGQFIVHENEFDEKNILKPVPVNLDPIVYVPVKYPTPGGAALIITQWGPEANLPEFN